ncbi:hypothetical protein CYMTET_19277, partial [Cymbomonas tetramitiformis]
WHSQSPSIRVTAADNGAVQLTTLNAVSSWNSSEAWAVGDDDNLLFTSDGGASWELWHTGFACPTCAIYDWKGVSFVDSANGYICGSQASIARTRNGGASWLRPDLPLDSRDHIIWAVQAVNSSRAFAVGGIDLMLHTMNGGETWSIMTTTLQHVLRNPIDLRTVHFVDENNGWAAGHQQLVQRATGPPVGNILYTNNGGQYWLRGSYPLAQGGTQHRIHGLFFRDGLEGWAVGEGGVVLRTTNGGQTWAMVDGCTDQNLHAVVVDVVGKATTDTSDGFLVGDDGVICHSQDAGASFEQTLESGSIDGLHAIAQFGGKRSIGCWQDGLITVGASGSMERYHCWRPSPPPPSPPPPAPPPSLHLPTIPTATAHHHRATTTTPAISSRLGPRHHLHHPLSTSPPSPPPPPLPPLPLLRGLHHHAPRQCHHLPTKSVITTTTIATTISTDTSSFSITLQFHYRPCTSTPTTIITPHHPHHQDAFSPLEIMVTVHPTSPPRPSTPYPLNAAF